MSILLPKGTKEFLVAIVTDNLGNVTTLDNVDVRYTVLDPDDEAVIDEATATTQEMTALCLIDTTNWTEGEYRLFVLLDIDPQQPVFGPFRFAVEDYTNDLPPVMT